MGTIKAALCLLKLSVSCTTLLLTTQTVSSQGTIKTSTQAVWLSTINWSKQLHRSQHTRWCLPPTGNLGQPETLCTDCRQSSHCASGGPQTTRTWCYLDLHRHTKKHTRVQCTLNTIILKVWQSTAFQKFRYSMLCVA